MAVVPPGAEISRERSARHVARHAHLAPYAALVLCGGYVEAGDRGRFRARAGDVLIHDRFEAHQDHFAPDGADILNLPLAAVPALAFGRVADPDAVVRVAQHDFRGAADMLVEALLPGRTGEADWPDQLAEHLRADRVARIRVWAEGLGLRPQSVSRGFRLAYGVTPQRFRAEQRAARAAWALGQAGLAEIALASGFADQPHMSRAVKRLYGMTPAALRRAEVHCVQDRMGAAR